MARARVTLRPQGRSFARARRNVLQKFEMSARLMCESAEDEFVGVVQTYAEGSPMATGQMSEAGHVRGTRQEGKSFTVGVGVRRLENGQEVIAEAQQMSTLHRSEHEHDPAGFRCSSGVRGGWGDEYEQVDVRSIYGGELRTNPRARQWPLGWAIVERLGSLVTQMQARSFQRGETNVYRTGAGIVKQTRFGRAMRVVARFAMERRLVLLILVLCSLWGMSEARVRKELKEYVMASDTTLAGSGWVRTRAFPVNYASDQRGLFDLHLHLVGDLADSVVCYAAVGSDTTALYPQRRSSDGDTLWVIPPSYALADSGWTQWEVYVRSGDYFSLMFQERGGSSVVLDSLTYVTVK